MRKISLLLFSLLLGLGVSAQNYSVDLTAGIGKISSVGLMARKNFYLGAKKKILIAPGIRLSYASSGSSQDYTTAPANLTSDEANIDTLAVGGTGIFSPNLAITLGYKFTDRLSFQFDIDLVGVSLGGQQTGTFRPGKNSANQQMTPTAGNKADPTSPNVLLVGDNDLGSLSSAFTLNYRLTDQISIKAGLGYYFTEYTTTNKLGSSSNDRFRFKSLQGAVGATLHF